MKPKIVALVPMRHHSQRIPGKNYRMLAGKPLFHHVLLNLQKVNEIEKIVIDTDSAEIIQGIQQFFPDVLVLERPENLRADEISMNEILLHDIENIKADYYLQTHSTNPLVRPETYQRAINTLVDSFPEYDSLFAVTRLQVRLWDHQGHPINHDPDVLLQTQDLPPVYAENSCFYLFTGETLRKRRNRLGERPMMFEIDRAEAWDIDEEIDFKLVEMMLAFKQ
jgi:CMP-N-acetylneuraminic acid synthetase